MRAKRSEGTEGVLAKRTRSSFQMHICDRLQRIKSLKMIVETSHKNQFSYFSVLNQFLKFTWPNQTQQCLWTVYISNSITDRNVSFLCNLDSSLKIRLLKFGVNIFNSLFSASLKFRLFSALFFYHNFRLKGKFPILMISSERSRSDLWGSTLF